MRGQTGQYTTTLDIADYQMAVRLAIEESSRINNTLLLFNQKEALGSCSNGIRKMHDRKSQR